MIKQTGEDQKSGIVSLFVPDTAHCAIMYPDSPHDSAFLKEARLTVERTVREWLGLWPSSTHGNAAKSFCAIRFVLFPDSLSFHMPFLLIMCVFSTFMSILYLEQRKMPMSSTFWRLVARCVKHSCNLFHCLYTMECGGQCQLPVRIFSLCIPQRTFSARLQTTCSAQKTARQSVLSIVLNSDLWW